MCAARGKPTVAEVAKVISPNQVQDQANLLAFEDYLQSKDFTAATIKYYTTGLVRLQSLTEELLDEPIALSKLVPRDVAQARDKFMAEGKAGSSANWLVFSAHQWGIYTGQEAEFKQIHAVQIGWKPKERLVETDYQRLLRTLDSLARPKAIRNAHDVALRDRCLFALLLGCGLRREETVYVRVSHIKLTPKAGWVRVIGKGRKERSAPIQSPWREMISDRIDEIYRDNKNGAGAENALLLNKLTPSGVDKVIRKWGTKANVPAIHAHKLRWTRGQLWRREGNSLEIVARWLGHDSIETTRIYTEDASVSMGPGEDDSYE
jgi:site-specific recombinase XerD